ncbi:hypothetical protein LWI28_028770 [Acer negundo]|uniref:Phosphatidic acid phosphatase type 2/haloperoxidase domain-containing protein n=1 Tax=Acer negundo TaxID=4023 RepID=A0AAD5NMG7_ACENE|nr:hypothetical protein LWI28_028770 [Acer negundo]KAK4840532.1 hypothetical protein QYF36_011178 [Acer negundo]
MSTTITNIILVQPSCCPINASDSSKLKSLKPTSVLLYSCRKSSFRGGFAAITMAEMFKTSAFRTSRDGDEDIRVMDVEHEALPLINGSTRSLSAGIESTLNRLSKWLVSGLFGALIIGRHDIEALWILMGSVLNAMLSIALKRILNQERPVSTLRSDPGMPSSHAQSIFFIFSFAIISIVEWLGLNGVSLTISGIVLASATYLTWLRVSQKLHTIPQVVVGAAVGSTFFTLWFLSWNALVMEAFDSSLWVQIIVYLGAAGLCLGFLLYVIRNWFKDER